MHLKPINRQGKKRRKLITVPVLSCDGGVFNYPRAQQMESSEVTLVPKKDKAAA